jgi:phage-related minor tail protein
MRRTISDARAFFEGTILPMVTDHRASECRQELEAAEQEARRIAGERIGQVEQEVREVQDTALRELTEVRDEFERLNRQPGIAAQELSAQLRKLRERQEAAEHRLGKATELVDRTEEIEQDPVAYYDSLGHRMPRFRYSFSW